MRSRYKRLHRRLDMPLPRLGSVSGGTTQAQTPVNSPIYNEPGELLVGKPPCLGCPGVAISGPGTYALPSPVVGNLVLGAAATAGTSHAATVTCGGHRFKGLFSTGKKTVPVLCTSNLYSSYGR